MLVTTGISQSAWQWSTRLLQQMPVVMEGDRVAVDISAEARGVYHAILTNGKKSYSGKIVFR